MFDRTYQPGREATPATRDDTVSDETVLVWRDGYGWVERPVESEPVPETGAEAAA